MDIPERPAPRLVLPVPGWFDRPVLDVARDLLGAHLTRHCAHDGTAGTADAPQPVTIKITEVEAYAGTDDPGSHAYRGRTARNGAMFGPGGRAYVYRHLGIHHCLNIVTGPVGQGAAVLLRAGAVVDGAATARERRTAHGVARTGNDLARGPGRLAVALAVDLSLDGADLTTPGGILTITVPEAPRDSAIGTGPRVGVSGVGGGPGFPWRFWLAGEPTVSGYRAAPAHRAARAVR